MELRHGISVEPQHAGGVGAQLRATPAVFGQHHVRMNMYIAQANNGSFKVVKNLGVIDPKEQAVIGASA